MVILVGEGVCEEVQGESARRLVRAAREQNSLRDQQVGVRK